MAVRMTVAVRPTAVHMTMAVAMALVIVLVIGHGA